MTTNREEMEKLKLLMLEAETAGQLAALIIDFTHEEIMQVYRELVLEQQTRIQIIWKTAIKREKEGLETNCEAL